MKTKTAFEKFDETFTRLLKVSHDEIKKKLDEEKKRKKSKKSSVSREAI